ncbi:BTAD domain-containing putative transcriptional regulator [Mycobacterium rhizamassiliense]
MLGLHSGSVVSAATLVELLWDRDPPRTADKALQTHISALRRTLGDGLVLTEGMGWTLAGTEVDASRYTLAARLGRHAAAAGDAGQAVARLEEALALWRGTPELPDSHRGVSEKTRWIERHAALVEDRADALLATGRAAEIVGELEASVADAPLRERRWGQLMLALYRAGRQGDALAAYQRARSLLADELGIDPGPELRRLETAIVAQAPSLDTPVAQQLPSVMRAVTFLLTDIEGSTAAWEADADAMAVALARHDELVEQVVTSRGGKLIKTRGEGDATFSVFDRPSAAAAAALELQEAIGHEPWELREPMRVRVALHTGEVELRDGDYFGRAVNRAARLRSLAEGGQILCSGATAELVIDSLPDDVLLTDLGMRKLKNLPRPEHVFELRLETADDRPELSTGEPPMERPALPPVLVGAGPFVGRGNELEQLLLAWQTTLTSGAHTVLIAGEPGVGKTRLSGEWSQQAYAQGAVVLYGRCDEDLGAPYQPFAEALRSLVPCIGAGRLRAVRGVEALLPLVPGLADVLPDVAPPARSDPDTERYALFDAVVASLEIASAAAPVVLILDDLHWAAKPTLLLLRHLLRFGDHARVQIVGTYRNTDLDRSHPLAATLADLHRDGTANRLNLSGLDEDDVTAYVAEAGYDDEELAHALASVTGGNPFFLIEALRHVDESGGVWDQSTLPQGVREAVSRRLSRLPADTNKALAAAAVVGSRFALELVEQVTEQDLVDAFDEACKAGIVIEEPGGYYRFNHALVRQSLLAELASVRRMRLHQRIAATLETQSGSDDELLAELAYHYFECAWAGNAVKAVEYCRRAADQAMARLAYEGAADLYDRALHALEEIDDELPDRGDQVAELLVARCEALLAAGDVASALGAVSQLQDATVDSVRLSAWATCFDGELSMLIHPERLDQVETALGAAAAKLAELDDAAGEAKAHTVRAGCLARLGRIGDGEVALDDALTAARRAREHRRVNAVLAQAPLAALWGPNPVPRAGGRCLDVVRLLRITTDSPAVEATSTRCQAVLEGFRGRTAAARRMIESARRSVTELGLRHALVEVEQFAGIVELVADDPAAAESHLRKAYNGFRRMGLDADTAETAALLGRTCLALDRDAEADELCSESERLAGHALKASIAWRTLRAKLLARQGDHAEARRVAEAAVSLAERTDALVDHGDACLSLAIVLEAAGDSPGARAAAERAADLYERKGAAALADRARGVLGAPVVPTAPAPPEAPSVGTNACVLVADQVIALVNREALDEVEQLFAPRVSVENRRKIVGFARREMPSGQWPRDMRNYLQSGIVRYRHTPVAIRGERVALLRLEAGTADASSGAPQDEMLQVIGLDEDGRIALEVSFDVEDIDAATAELDSAHARLELDTECVRVGERVIAAIHRKDWDEFERLFAPNVSIESRRKIVGFRVPSVVARRELRRDVEMGATRIDYVMVAARGERLALSRLVSSTADTSPGAPHDELLQLYGLDEEGRVALQVWFDVEDMDAAIAELDAAHARLELDNACTRVIRKIDAAYDREAWGEIEQLVAAVISLESRRKIVGLEPHEDSYDEWERQAKQFREIMAPVRHRHVILAVRGERLALTRLEVGPADLSPGAPRDEFLQLYGIDKTGRLALQMWFDAEDIDAATAELDKRHARLEGEDREAPRLENETSQMAEHLVACFTAREWDAMTEVLADDFRYDDRRHVVGAGIRHGRGSYVSDLRTAADLWVANIPTVIATRGERLALGSLRFTGREKGSEEFLSDLLIIAETNTDNLIVAIVTLDHDDFDAAIEELDARYIAGEAAANRSTWSAITRAYAAIDRRELPSTTAQWVNIDHRKGRAFAPGDLIPYVQATWDTTPQSRIHIEAVHRLTGRGAVVTNAMTGSSRDGFDAEWREVFLLTLEGDNIDRCELFDEADLDAAIAKFEELSRPTPRLENAASRANTRMHAYFSAGDWDGVAATLDDDVCAEDRRRVVNAETQRGRGLAIDTLRQAATLGVTHATSNVVATRGEHLALTRARFSQDDAMPETFHVEVLQLIESSPDERLTAIVMFDLEDFEGAAAELDARYLAGEAAEYAPTWSVIAKSFTSMNRRELPSTTPNCQSIDHRRAATFAPGDVLAYIQAGFDLDEHMSRYFETVHRLNNLGAVVTYAAHGTSREGLDAEWRGVTVYAIDGDMFSRVEIFDEADLDAALTRFEELQPNSRRLENAASRVTERFLRCFDARDWDVVDAIVASDMCHDDRRRIVGAGVRHGRDAQVEDMRVLADMGMHATAEVIAIRGERLVLSRNRGLNIDSQPEAFLMDVIDVAEIDSDGRIIALITFDPGDIDAAFAELDARHLAGEAAPYARMWQLAIDTLAEVNRHEVGPILRSLAYQDHRRVPFAAEGFGRAVEALWALVPNARYWIPVIHALDAHGIVASLVIEGTDVHGGELQWTRTLVQLLDEPRFEVYEEDDIEAALAKFEELRPRQRRLENVATRVNEHIWACIAARDWDATTASMADNMRHDDRRRMVGAGVLQGRDAQMQDMLAIAEIAGRPTIEVIATRGERLALTRARFEPQAFLIELLAVIESDGDERLAAMVAFDLDDIDAAFAELDARYLAGEAATHAQTWSAIAGISAAFNRHELPPMTPDPVYVDHRQLAWAEGIDLAAAIRGFWDITSDARAYIEAVYRLDDRGAVFTQVLKLTSNEGFDAELPMIYCFTVEGDLISGVEVFDLADIDAALARFEELHPQTQRPQNAASRLLENYLADFAIRDWAAMEERLAEDFFSDDRRRIANAGIRRGRDAEMANWRATSEVWMTNANSLMIATRGERLVLGRFTFTDHDQQPDAFQAAALAVVEINKDDQIAASITFDPDDADTAFAELDARYLAGEAANHSATWSVVMDAYAALNRGEISPTATDFVDIDHRSGATVGPGDLKACLRTALEETVHDHIYVEAVHRLTDVGAVVSQKTSGTSREGFHAEWPIAAVFTVKDDLLSRTEMFDETAVDAAMARFEELQPRTRQLENAVSQVVERFWSCLATQDWAAMAETMADDFSSHDRRRVVNAGVLHGRDVNIANMRAVADVGFEGLTSSVIATRGQRLALARIRSSAHGFEAGEVSADMLGTFEVDADNRLTAGAIFDSDDIDAAHADLDARYLAGEAASNSATWSLITGLYADFNRQDLPTADWITIDHRRGSPFASGDLAASIRASLDLTPNLRIRVESVHRLSNLGALVTNASSGTSREGLDAEWRMVQLLTNEDGRINRLEIFDETDLDAALARFEELQAG